MLVGDILRKPLIELTKLANISCKVFRYRAIPHLFPDLRSSKMEQMKGIDAIKNGMPANSFVVPAGGRYLKKASHRVD